MTWCCLVCSNITCSSLLGKPLFLKEEDTLRTMLGQGRLILRDSPLERGKLGNGGLAPQKAEGILLLPGHIEPSCDQSTH